MNAHHSYYYSWSSLVLTGGLTRACVGLRGLSPGKLGPSCSVVGAAHTETLAHVVCRQEHPGHPTFIALSRWVVEGQSQGDDGCNLQDDECHVL